MTAMHLHSIPTRDAAGPCAVTGRFAHPRLRRYVVGYGGSRSACGTAVRHRVLPLNLVTVIIELDGTVRLVTGPRTFPALFEQTLWGGQSITIGLTPAGAAALLRTRMRDLAHTDVPLEDLLGRRDAELAERLDAAPDWSARFALLDERLTAWLSDDLHQPDDSTLHAWRLLQHPVGRPRINTLAAQLGISQRALQARFQRYVGLSPVSVARVARFQHAIAMLTRRHDLPRVAHECGYADQSHFNREIRAMADLTPTQLCAFLQYQDLVER